MDLFWRTTLCSVILQIYFGLKLFCLSKKPYCTSTVPLRCAVSQQNNAVGKEKIGLEKKEGNLAAVSAQSDVLLARRQVSQPPLLRE